ncbi:hypothetical protein Pen01_60840 [Phytomonospora endophytica]|nr:hypothetical protein Pen01_60840 [Phytomonospora endophytica]
MRVIGTAEPERAVKTSPAADRPAVVATGLVPPAVIAARPARTARENRAAPCETEPAPRHAHLKGTLACGDAGHEGAEAPGRGSVEAPRCAARGRESARVRGARARRHGDTEARGREDSEAREHGSTGARRCRNAEGAGARERVGSGASGV